MEFVMSVVSEIDCKSPSPLTVGAAGPAEVKEIVDQKRDSPRTVAVTEKVAQLSLSSFSIHEVLPEGFRDHATLINIWLSIASKKRKASEKAKKAESEKLFKSAWYICRCIKECLQRPDRCKEVFDRVFICVDENKSVQATMLTHSAGVLFYQKEKQKKYIRIAHIAAHPFNIQAWANSALKARTKGSGSSLVRDIAIKSLQDKSLDGIYAEVVPSAIGFYQKLGFQVIPKADIKMSEPAQTPMVLPREVIEKWL